MNKANVTLLVYGIAIVGLFFYSFTQVDLNLTLSKISLAAAMQDFFQHIGYFQRPLSTLLYNVIISLLFICYGIFIWLGYHNKLTKKKIFVVAVGTAFILLWSYPAFSYDIYNYMFDARIVTEYGQNPYEHKALDYPEDPWINFMRWTHRTYPYGPVWLGLTIPLSFLGFGYFLPTLYLFKLLSAIAYIGSVIYISKILEIISPKRVALGTVFFALNPFVIIESLVSAHNDIIMMFIALVSLYYLFQRQFMNSFIALLISGGIKFATLFVLPVLLIYRIFTKPKQISPQQTINLILLCMLGALIAVYIRSEYQYQPWYLLYILPFAALSLKYYWVIPSVVLSVASLVMYIPFLYSGNWDPPIPSILNTILISGVVLSALLLTGRFVVRLK